MSVAIIMTVFNRIEQTRRCIADLEKALVGIRHTYYVTNDGSTDETGVYLQSMSEIVDLNVTLGDGQLFWNRGMHVSYEKALNNKHDYYLWVNNDTSFFEDMWDTLMSNLESALKMNRLSVVCGSVKSECGEATYGGTNANGLISPQGSIVACTHINGNCLLIPQYVAEKIGNLDYRYEHGLGDFDYGQRILAAGGNLFASSRFVGTCEKNGIKGTWKDVTLPIKDRIKKMKQKTGQPRESYKIYLKKWNRRTWIFYYYKPYFDIIASRMKYIIKGR